MAEKDYTKILIFTIKQGVPYDSTDGPVSPERVSAELNYQRSQGYKLFSVTHVGTNDVNGTSLLMVLVLEDYVDAPVTARRGRPPKQDA